MLSNNHTEHMKEIENDIERFYDQGRRHLQSDGADFSLEKGMFFLKQAADLGHAKAQYNLGVYLHESGLYADAHHYFTLAAHQKNPRANYMLGCYEAFGLIDSASEINAAYFFQLAADAGVAEAQYNLAVLLLQGKEILKSEKEAIHYFMLAAKQGNRDALYNLGICYYQGLGVTASQDESIRYLELAVKHKHPKAAETLERIMMSS
jgi:TPR repeat protein